MVPANYLSATATQALLRSGKLTVTQIAKDHLARYDERNDAVRAWVSLDRDRVLREAARLDALPPGNRGELWGVVIGIKDMMNTFDMPTQHGSAIYKDSQPGTDAAAVAICRAAGALIIGKTYTTEFAATMSGPPTGNAYHQGHTPGGSSSGSAAAVSDYQCHVALGTQTIGSIVRPASFNGIYGFKPTWGAISREGAKISSLTLDTLGFFSRSIDDLKLLSKVFHIEDDIPPPPISKPLSQSSFAFIKTQQWTANSGPSTELQRTWDTSKALLLSSGAKVEEVDLGPEFNDIAGVRGLHILSGEGRVNFLAEYTLNKPLLADNLQGDVENRHRITRRMQLDAYDQLAALRPIIDRLASRYDAIITPSVTGEAPAGLGWTGDPRFCAMWTALQVPVINIPGFAGDKGLPIGLTLVAPRYEDERLLSVAQVVAAAWKSASNGSLLQIPAPEGVEHHIA